LRVGLPQSRQDLVREIRHELLQRSDSVRPRALCWFAPPLSKSGFESAKEQIAVHKRCFGKGRFITELSHYLGLLEKKPRAARTALAVIQAGLPEAFELFRRYVEDETGALDLRFVGVLRLAVEGLGLRRVSAKAAERGDRGPRGQSLSKETQAGKTSRQKDARRLRF
jgi:hypothetical protein